MAVTPAELRETLLERARAGRERAEVRRRQAVASASAVCQALVEAGAVAEAWLIGSAAWGAFGDRSDLDVVVRGLTPGSAPDVADRLTAASGIAVDLLRWEELAPSFRARVARDGLRLA